jgi:hypothetical protein
MRSVWALAGLALALGVASAPPVAAGPGDEKAVQVVGQAAVVNNDVALAKDRAKKDAFRNALEQVAGVKVQSVTTVKDFQLVSDAVSAKAEGMIKEYKILEEKVEGGVASVKIDAVVSKTVAEDGLPLLLMEANNPKVAFIISERMAGQTDFSLANQERGKTENLLIDYFTSRGMTVVDLAGIAGVSLGGGSAGELTAADAEKLAEKADAQFIVIGKVVGTDAGPIMNTGMRSYSMSLTFKMFSTATHEVVATVTKSNAVPCTAANLAPVSCAALYKQRVIEPAAQELMVKTAKAWLKGVSGAKRVQVLATVANFGALQKFITALPADVRGVKSVQQRSFKAGKAVLDVELEGDTNYLAAELSAKKIGGAAVEVTAVNADRIEVELKK